MRCFESKIHKKLKKASMNVTSNQHWRNSYGCCFLVSTKEKTPAGRKLFFLTKKKKKSYGNTHPTIPRFTAEQKVKAICAGFVFTWKHWVTHFKHPSGRSLAFEVKNKDKIAGNGKCWDRRILRIYSNWYSFSFKDISWINVLYFSCLF